MLDVDSFDVDNRHPIQHLMFLSLMCSFGASAMCEPYRSTQRQHVGQQNFTLISGELHSWARTRKIHATHQSHHMFMTPIFICKVCSLRATVCRDS